VVVQADTGLISEVDGRSRNFSLGADRRAGLVLPPLHGTGVLLTGAMQRTLRRQPELAQQPPDADHRQGDLKFAPDHLADHLPGPQRELELHLPGIPARDQRIQPGQLRAAQLRRAAGHRPGFQPATGGTVD
jgi:hypothetical protein